MDRDAQLMRGSGPTIFAQVKNGVGVDEIVKNIEDALRMVEIESHMASKQAKKSNV